MRLFYATAAALAPLLFAAGAQAQVVINTARTTPVQTSNAGAGGVPANVEIASGGAVNVNSGVGVTVDSDNTLTISTGGSINMTNAADGAIGVLVAGGVNTTILLSGSIGLADTITSYPDTDGDGDLDGPWATGSGRYGIRLAGPVTGDVRVETSGAILVEGNDSWGIAIDDGLTGDLRMLGDLRVFGDRTTGVGVTGTLDGDAYLGGTVNAFGEDAIGARFTGDVTGRVNVQSNITASGYRYTTRPADSIIEKLDADDLLQGGPALWIGANVAAGLLIDGLPTETDANSTDDDGDGVIDSQEISARIQSFGEAPAVLVGSMTQAVTLGVVGTGTNAYGLINNGLITGQGIYDGVAAQGVRLGMDGGQAVTIDGGVRNGGQIAALAFEADATAVRVGAGVSTPRLESSGFITAGASSEVDVDVTALLIEAGASLPSFSNSGSLLASAGGGAATVTGILDLSGTLTSITNTGSMQATLSANADGDPITGTTTLIDVRANTTGVTLLQEGVTSTPGSGDSDTDGDGVPDSREPIMVGDILLGSGADLIDVRNGTVIGDIAFGDGADRLTITGDASVTTALSDTDGLLDVEVIEGELVSRHDSAVQISNLTVGEEGRLIVTIDPDAGEVSGYQVSGTATFEDDSALGVRFRSLIDAPERFTIVDAGTLVLGDVAFDSIEENSPYLFRVEGGADVASGQVYVDVRRRTADEAGLISAEAGLFDAFYGALESDDALLNAFLSQTERAEFIDLYEQLLPEHSGGPLLSLAGGVDAVTRALVGRNAAAAPGQGSAWLQEITFYADKDKTDTYGFRSEGFGVAGGFEMGTDYGNVGVSLAFTSADLEDPESAAEEVVSASLIELGLYWRAQGQYWTTWARAAGGYATFDSTRRFVGSGLNLTNTSSWNGWTAALAGGASYERNYGRFTLRPEVYAEYFMLNEDAHVETGGGGAFDLEIDEREGHMFSATAAMNVSMAMGEGSWLRPELRLGWRQNISVDPGVTRGRFTGGGSDFAISPDGIEGGGPIVGFRLNVGNELGMLSVSADAEMIDDYVRYMLLLRASFRF
ncbi:MAG: autotransporter domain-containing protein [Alphaproteobacteria bacterium]|nr:autotransporter domain-containing protein [Alphaproteobacteria bacterium]MBU1527466.1 autotransporter domain-containing protein [Alphaproteobacteria bacterium]MBU2352664.1 autotransporter domain-containing protein [Alphaproteobacteria bacterium]MBU2383039.1 autotransporter domain-containing protein [Alphaproteobacteria bacterium]